MRLFSDTDVREILTGDLARTCVRLAASEYSAGAAIVPPRIQMHLPEDRTELLVMPGALPRRGALGVKTVGEFPRNASGPLPTAPATVLLLDATTGEPQAFFNATALTQIRTAAMSVVAAEYLAVREPASLAVIGAGGQALAHIEAFAERFPLTTIRLTSRTRARAEATAARAAERGIPVEVVGDAADAVHEAQIVIAATTSPAPVIPDAALAPGTCVIGVGAHSPAHAEIDPATVARAGRVAVDTRPGAIDGAGDITAAIQAGALSREDVAELGDLVDARIPGRTCDDEITVFKSIGFSALDLVVCQEIAALAQSLTLGTEVVF